MFYSTLLIAASAICGLVSAQNYSTSGPLSIDPNSVAIDLRQAWCRSQTASCPQICGGQAYPNTCDSSTLMYTCTCTDGSHPNISSYGQTIPSFVCQQWRTDCVAAHPNDLDGQTACLSVTCGEKNASAVGSTGSSPSGSASASSAAATASATKGSSGGKGSKPSASASASASSSKSSPSSAAVMNVAMNYGTGILAAGMLAVFGLAL